MKRIISLSLVVLLLMGITAFRLLTTPKKIALVVAVAEYPQGGRWRNLSSMNDYKYVKDALLKNGFAEKDLHTLFNQQATRAGIVKALDDLYNQVGDGDVVYFQFSGHGQQIEDDNGDEADGYDEALIPYDAAAQYDPVTYKGENHLRDDVLGEKLNSIRRKIGAKGSLLVLIDACHSGTATRDAGVKRGTEIPFQSPGYQPKVRINLQGENGMFENLGSDLGSMIVFSACSPNQPNYEMKDAERQGVGSLSYAFARSIADLQPGSSYHTLFLKMKTFIQADIPGQIPMVEGNTNIAVLAGNYTPKPQIIAVQKRLNDTTFTIDEGLLNNLGRGTVLQVYPLGSTTLYCEGVINQVGNFQSICTARKPLEKSKAYEVKITAVNNGDFAATLWIQNSNGNNKSAAALATQLQQHIQSVPYLSLSDHADYTLDIVTAKEGSSTITLVEKGDKLMYSLSIAKDAALDATTWKQLLDGIKRSMRARYLRNMQDGGMLAKDITVEIVPKQSSANPNEIICKPGDAFDIRITNKSLQDYYYTIIDLMPDNEVKVLIPEEGKEAADYVIGAKGVIPIGEFTVDAGTPNGKENFKVIISKTPMDLRSVLNRTKTRGSNNLRSVEAVMDDMFNDSRYSTTTRATMSNVKLDEVGILTCGITIVN